MRRELRYFRWWLVLGWLIVVAVIALSLISKVPIHIPVQYSDKVGHVIAYTVLMGWFVQLFQSRKILLLHAVFLIAMGVGLEFLQGYSGRHFEYADMLANCMGVVLGFVLLFTPLRTLLQSLEERFFKQR